MNSSPSLTRSFIAFFALLGTSGCLALPEPFDAWSVVMPRCDYVMPAGSRVEVYDEERIQTTLRPACREALEEVLPLDESFDSAPAGTKDHVLEAFQVLAAYPLKLPAQNRILGVAPGSIPALHLCLLGAPNCPTGIQNPAAPLPGGDYRKNVFNLVVNAFEEIRYDPSLAGDFAARNDFHLSVRVTERTLNVGPRFWSLEDSVGDLLRGTFGRAAILVHEAGHSQGMYHEYCSETGRFSCDPDLKGPNGLSIVYAQMLLTGSGHLKSSSGFPILSDLDLLSLGYLSCRILKERVTHLPAPLEDLLEGTACGDVSSQWTAARLRLQR
jgi:hypothetical protein